MAFSSITVLAFFLPAVLAVYYAVPSVMRKTRNFVLFGAGFVFYALGGVRFVVLLAVSIVINYAGGLAVSRSKHRKMWLIFDILFNVFLLGYFKYVGFFVSTLNCLGLGLAVHKIALPIGISFFTFQGISYVVDVYKGVSKPQKNLIDAGLYLSFFPQLMSGPIVRYNMVSESLDAKRESLDGFSAGLVRFLIGLGKKMILTNPMEDLANAVFSKSAGELSVSLAWLGIIAYTLQIYLDFSSYSDMAIGIAKMFGFKFPENFNYPYVSKSVTEFWRRWHITLSSWFRDYVYFPMGGSRCSRGRNILNLAVVWSLTGLWHGANFTFVLWGLWFLLLLIIEKFLLKNILNKLPGFLTHIYTMVGVMLGWVLFRSENLSSAVGYIGAMFGFGNGEFLSNEAIYYLRLYLPVIVISIIASLPIKEKLEKYLIECDTKASRFALCWLPKAFALLLLAVSYVELVTGSFRAFIYFQF